MSTMIDLAATAALAALAAPAVDDLRAWGHAVADGVVDPLDDVASAYGRDCAMAFARSAARRVNDSATVAS